MKFIIFLIGLILIPSIYAQLSLSPSLVNADVRVGNEIYVNITITNNANKNLYNISFDSNPYFSAPSIPELNIAQSKTIEGSILTNHEVSETLEIKLRGYFLTQVTSIPLVYSVNIFHNRFEPSNLEIRQGDTLKWTNKDSELRNVFSQDLAFDQDINPNESWSYTFNSIGDYIYRDDILLFTGVANVLTNQIQEPTHDENYDAILTLNLESSYSPALIEYELLKTEFTIEEGDLEEAIIKLTNIGNETAKNLSLASDSEWIIFRENYFDIAEDKTNFVEFVILPFIHTTNETNKTYEVNLILNGNNIPKMVKKIDIFIPYSEIVEGLDEGSNVESILKEFKRLQELIQKFNLTEGNESIIYKELSLGYNFTESDIKTMLERVGKTELDFQRLTEILNPVLNYVQEQQPSYLQKIEGYVNETINELRQVRTSLNTLNLIFSLLLFMGLMIGIGHYGLKIYKEKKRKEGRFLG